MPRISHLPAEICPNNHLLSIPIDGRWAWDEKEKELVYESGNGMNGNEGWHSDEISKIDLRTGRTHHRKQHRPLQHVIKTKDNNKITLLDIIQASVNVMSEMFYIPIEFAEYLRMLPVHEFLLHLLNYFYWFFETMNNAIPRPGRHIDRSEMEKTRIRTAYARLLTALRELTCKYAVLLLGIDLQDFHHMRNGDLFYSCTELDRTTFESLFVFSTYFTWIAFYRQHFDSIRTELTRLFRAGGDIEVIKIPVAESSEDRFKNNMSHGPMTRHKLIDCTEFYHGGVSTKRASSMFDDISEKSNSLFKQSRTKNRLESLLGRDANAEGLHSVELDRKYPLRLSQRQNRLRGVLTKQLKSPTDEQQVRSKKDSKTDGKSNFEKRIREREKSQRERLTMRRLLTASFPNNSPILPVPTNPLDESRKDKEELSMLPRIQFQLMENLGILGKPSSDFDLIRLTLKSNIEDNISIPSEFLITLPTPT